VDKIAAARYVPFVALGDSRARLRASEPGYSIRVASRLTQIEPDTLRMWERRYGFPVPTRTAGGSRVYSEADVETLLLIRRAMKAGYRPGEVVGRRPAEISQMITRAGVTPPEPAGGAVSIDSVVAALVRDDVKQLRAEVKNLALMLGPKRFVTDLAFPLVKRAGEMWAAGELEVRQEHLLSDVVATQLRVLLAAFDDAQDGPIVILTTLPDEVHGLGLSMVALYCAVSQVVPRVLGLSTPPEQIVSAAKALDAAAIGISVVLPPDPARVAKQLKWIAAELPKRVRVWAGGHGASLLGLKGDAIDVVQSWSDLDAVLGALR
jgi:MerR family transcriptional regulator, light-induced transcriptional regulator